MINLSSPQEDNHIRPRITVIGVGGAGGNAVNNMIKSNLEGVEFLVCNTDAQALAGSLAERRLQLGQHITQGLGAGAKPEIGRAAAEEALEDIVSYLEGSHMAFITAGLGGGTGTGAAPVIARSAREQGMLTVGVVTKPFLFEGTHRMRIAEEGLKELQEYVDTLIVIPNQNLFRVANEKTTFADAFKMADNVLNSGVRGVTDLMVMPGLINLDFADIRSVMAEMGKAMMGTGEAEGDSRAVHAAEAAISNPLLDDVSMKGARGVLINITGGVDMTLYEVDEAANRIRDEVDPDANIIFGSTFDESMEGRLRVSVVATGIDTIADSRRGAESPSSALHLERPRSGGVGSRSSGVGPFTHGGRTSGPTSRTTSGSAARQSGGHEGGAGAEEAAAREEEPARGPLFAAAPVTAARAPAPPPERPAPRPHAAAEAAGLDAATLRTMVISEREEEPARVHDTAHDHESDRRPMAHEHAHREERRREEIAPRPVAREREDVEEEAEERPAKPRRRAGNLFRRMTGLFIEEEAEAAEQRGGGQQGNWNGQQQREGSGRRDDRADDRRRDERPPQSRMSAHPAEPERSARGQASQPRLDVGNRGPLPKHDDDGFDIPAFLRRQAN